MKVSVSWLNEYIPITMDVDELSHALTMAGLEIDSVKDRYEYLKDVIVARIESIKPHPDADKLQLCEIETGNGIIPVVCGATNIETGMIIPLALPGTVLPDGTVLKKGKIRGQVSEGMLCSGNELSLDDSASGIMSLEKDFTVGTSVKEALKLSDMIIEIDLTPNRPDCLGILGIAREISAIQGNSVQYPEFKEPATEKNINDHTSVIIENSDLCPRYTARLIFDIKVGSSPFWLQDRLTSVGLKPINNIVDITNYVMLETGQPLHAFDYDQLAENKIIVRTANDEDKFTTLDEKERKLLPDMLMICDGSKPVAIGGVMGGMNSEIEDSSKNVLIESAYFSPVSIRKTSKKLGLHTDATHRFERGVDPEGTITALNRAAQLMTELGEGKLLEGIIDNNPKKSTPLSINLSVSHTNRLLGLSLSADQMAKHLESVEFKVEKNNEDNLSVVVPSYRVDVSRPVDIMEEIARLSGYDNIPVTYPLSPAESTIPSSYIETRNKIKTSMLGFGLSETINYSFISSRSCDLLGLPDNDERRRMLNILNPLTEEQGVMRTSLIPGLLTTAHHNITKQVKNIKIFEAGKVFFSNGQDKLPLEIEMIAGLITGSKNSLSWYEKETPCDFYDVKGIVEALFNELKISDVNFSLLDKTSCYYTRQGYSAEITVNDEYLGIIGKINPNVSGNYEIKQDSFIFELNLEKIIELVPENKSSKPLPKYPAVTRDITIIIDQTLLIGDILNELDNSGEDLLESSVVFDVYEGKPIPDEKRSISIRLTYRSLDKTLKDKQINAIHNKVTENLLKKFNAGLPA